MRRQLFIIILCFSPIMAIYGQDGGTSASAAEANKLLSEGLYGKAFNLWDQISAMETDNANAHFKAGLCLYHMPGKRGESLPYFKEASSNMAADYNYYDKDQKQAPYDALLYLGQAYLHEGKPDSALDYFISYQRSWEEEAPVDVERYIWMCVNARKSKLNPRDVSLVPLAENLNSTYAERNPVVTIDNSIMFYSAAKPRNEGGNGELDDVTGNYKEDIYIANKDEDNNWSDPGLFKLSTDANEAPLGLSADGLTFYFRVQEKGVYNIYQSRFIDGVWTDPEKLGGKINSAYNETGISISGDGQHLYLISDREGGQGNYDIYHATRKGNGKWSKPHNIGDKVNTPFDEISVFIHPNGRTLFYSSNGYKTKGMGGYDIYYSEVNEDGEWGSPQNMGYPINSTRDDMNYYIASGGIRYLSRINEDHGHDLYRIVGGGFDFENVELGTEVVTLTQEMDVTEVMELEKEVEKEVEVVEFVETETTVEDEVEEVDIPMLDEETPDFDLGEEEVTEEVEEEEEPYDKAMADMGLVDSIKMDVLDNAAREALIVKVQEYLAANSESTLSGDMFSESVYFGFDSYGLTEYSKNKLDKIAQTLLADTDYRITLVGHTDSVGNRWANLSMSDKRAESVYNYLLSKNVPKDRMSYYGKGDYRPAVSNEELPGRRKNRRVEIIAVK